MFNDTIFKIAFGVSLAAHVLVISAGSFFGEKPVLDKTREIEVTYFVPEEPRDELQQRIIENLPRTYELEKKELQESAREKRPSEEPGLEKTDAVPSEEQYLEEKES